MIDECKCVNSASRNSRLGGKRWQEKVDQVRRDPYASKRKGTHPDRKVGTRGCATLPFHRLHVYHLLQPLQQQEITVLASAMIKHHTAIAAVTSPECNPVSGGNAARGRSVSFLHLSLVNHASVKIP